MYNKIKKALIDMVFEFKELERVEFPNGVVIGETLRVKKSAYVEIYIELAENGEIEVWDEKGNHLFTVHKKEMYLMLFELGWIMNN